MVICLRRSKIVKCSFFLNLKLLAKFIFWTKTNRRVYSRCIIIPRSTWPWRGLSGFVVARDAFKQCKVLGPQWVSEWGEDTSTSMTSLHSPTLSHGPFIICVRYFELRALGVRFGYRRYCNSHCKVVIINYFKLHVPKSEFFFLLAPYLIKQIKILWFCILNLQIDLNTWDLFHAVGNKKFFLLKLFIQGSQFPYWIKGKFYKMFVKFRWSFITYAKGLIMSSMNETFIAVVWIARFSHLVMFLGSLREL